MIKGKITDYEKLKQVIQQANPEIVYKICLDCNEKVAANVKGYHKNCGAFLGGLYTEEREIRLADVLIAVQKIVHPLGKSIGLDDCRKQVLWYWRLQTDNLDNQPEGTKRFLINLLVKK